MCTSSYIKRFVFQLSENQIFTTRELLNFGSRGSIDQTIYRLIKAGIIQRLARGVFVKAEQIRDELFSVHEIAKIKAESFGRNIIIHARDVAHQLKLLPSGNQEITYATDGASSSFNYRGIRIHFKKTSNKKMQLGDTQVGQIMRGLEYLGKNICTIESVKTATSEVLYLIPLKEKLRATNAMVPAWLVDTFNWYKSRSCVWHGTKKAKLPKLVKSKMDDREIEAGY